MPKIRYQHSDLTPEMRADVEGRLSRAASKILGRPVKIELFDPGPGMKYKTGLSLTAVPAVTKDEEALVYAFLEVLNTLMGGSPIIKSGKA
jgi:hypothetical protein